MRSARLFLASFLVLFLEVALIRWMPAYVRLLSYFSSFILLASFLGIGVGCLLASSRRHLFAAFPALFAVVVIGVDRLRLEVAVPSTTSLYFSSGTAQKIVHVESTILLPLLFIVVSALFVTVAQRMGREMARLPPLRAYAINLLGSLAGVVAFGLISWLELPPLAWFAVASAVALPFVWEEQRLLAATNVALLAVSLAVVHQMARDSLWSPYYRITVHQDQADTVVEVNNIFHQSMAPLDRKEYFYEWPYTVFGETFDDVLILGAGTGTDVAAALRHGARRVDAVEIDPVILRLGAERHPDRPYADPRVRTFTDDARHFLRTTERQYDLVVFALVDSLTLQSSFSGVRLESYLFTEESFRAVREHLKPRGVMVLYNYFREKWLVDRLANTVVRVFGDEPRAHVHQDRAYLAVMMAGSRLTELRALPPPPDRLLAYGQPRPPSPARALSRDPTIVPATDNWPFLYLRSPDLPGHYLTALGWVLAISMIAVFFSLRAGSNMVRLKPDATGDVEIAPREGFTIPTTGFITSVVSAFRRTGLVRLKPDATGDVRIAPREGFTISTTGFITSVVSAFRLRMKLRRTAVALAEAVRRTRLVRLKPDATGDVRIAPGEGFTISTTGFITSVVSAFRRTRLVRLKPDTSGNRWSWHFFLLGVGFMLLETKSIVQFALLWGSTWTSASLAIVAVLVMALVSAVVAARTEIRRTGTIALVLFALLAINYVLPVGHLGFESRVAESAFYGVLVFSPVFCAGLLFGASFKRSQSTAEDFGANLLGAMVGGVGEYLSLVTGYRFLLVVIAGCYLMAVLSAPAARPASHVPPRL